MSYEFDLYNVPSEDVAVGEPIEPRIEVCCTNDDGCNDIEAEMFLEGEMVGGLSLSPIGELCVDLVVGGHWSDEGVDEANDTPGWYDIDGEQLIINEAGEYKISSDQTSQEATITVVDTSPDVSVDGCSISDDRVEAGEPFTIAATVENDGGSGEFTAVLSDQDGEIESETFEIDANGSRDIEFEVTYDTPNTDGYEPSIDVS